MFLFEDWVYVGISLSSFCPKISASDTIEQKSNLKILIETPFKNK